MTASTVSSRGNRSEPPGSPSRLAAGTLLYKRLFDLVLGSLVLLVMSPILVLIGIAIAVESPGGPFFRQERLGLHGSVFRIFKFRTMRQGPTPAGPPSPLHRDDPRITHLGHILRRYRLDEFPQLINVLRGEMSLVGPRPLLPEYLPYYQRADRRRLEMPPGMTGWQQVHGAATNTWDERVALDVWYVDHWSPGIDLVVLCKTLLVVFKADTVYDRDGYQRSGIPPAAMTVTGGGEHQQSMENRK